MAVYMCMCASACVGVNVLAVVVNGVSQWQVTMWSPLVLGSISGPQLRCSVHTEPSQAGEQHSRSRTTPSPCSGQAPIKPVRYEKPPYLGQGL